jgi:hypothetical protein
MESEQFLQTAKKSLEELLSAVERARQEFQDEQDDYDALSDEEKETADDPEHGDTIDKLDQNIYHLENALDDLDSIKL